MPLTISINGLLDFEGIFWCPSFGAFEFVFQREVQADVAPLDNDVAPTFLSHLQLGHSSQR